MAVSASMKANESALGPRLPLRLGRFTLCEELGAGGMATVYLARMDLAGGLDRLVALKTIHTHLAKEANFVDMFLDEARIASHVSHPNVCSTYDFGEVDNVYYLAMEYLLGEPLFDVINRMVERFEETREVLPFLAARIIADAAEGLHAAHNAHGPGGERLSIVHRDVSPQNLFVTYDGSVKVVDFGCAKAAERVAHTSTGVLKGKVAYAAPEQLKAEAVDHRADVFALGVCLWECLTLSPLFSKDAAVKTAMAVLQDDIELASDGRDWVPLRVAEIADRALSRNRDQRYASAREMSRDLRRFIADSGFTLESAELAEWMDFLFEERHEDRISQTTRVREMDISGASTGPLYVDDEDVEMLASEPAPLEAIIEPDEPEPVSQDDVVMVGASTESVDEAPPHIPTRRRWPWLVLLLLLLGVGGYYWHLHYEMSPWVYEMIGLDAPTAAGAASTLEEEGAAASGDVDRRQETDLGGPEGAATAEPSAPPASPNETEAAAEEAAPDLAARDGVASSESAGAAAAANPSSGAGRRGRRREPASRTVTTVVSGGGGSWSGSAAPTAAPVPTPAPADTRTGAVSIRAASGWANVYQGSRSLGRTPLTVDLPPGRHTLRIVPQGEGPSENLSVQVHAGIDQTLTLNIAEP